MVCDFPPALHEFSIKDPRPPYCTHARGPLIAFVQLGRSWRTFLRFCYLFLPSCLFATFMQFGLYDPSSSAAKILSPKFVAMSLYYCIVFLAAVRPLPCFMQIVLHAFQSPPQGRESCLRNKSTLQVVLSIFSGSASNRASRFEELMIARLIACVSQRGHCFQNLCCAFVLIIAHVALR
jgi:hypothetical protein